MNYNSTSTSSPYNLPIIEFLVLDFLLLSICYFFVRRFFKIVYFWLVLYVQKEGEDY